MRAVVTHARNADSPIGRARAVHNGARIRDDARRLIALHADGMTPTDTSFAGRRRLSWRADLPGAVAWHQWDGEVRYDSSVMNGLRSLSANQPRARRMGIQQTLWRRATSALSTVIHEELHGHSSGGPRSYTGSVGVGFEEATTELAARHITARFVGRRTNLPDFALTMHRINNDYSSRSGAYGGYIQRLHQRVEEGLREAGVVTDAMSWHARSNATIEVTREIAMTTRSLGRVVDVDERGGMIGEDHVRVTMQALADRDDGVITPEAARAVHRAIVRGGLNEPAPPAF